MINAEDILGQDGRIAARLKNYEFRPQQIEMANAVSKAVADKQHLVVEAGTGVGKSFGYLVPAILSLADEKDPDKQEEKKRVVISTHTISLQEQLMSKDIPLLNSVIPLEFSAVLAKGRNNYLSLRRLKSAIRRADSLFDTDDQFRQLSDINRWTDNTTEGSRSEFGFRLLPQVWDEVQSDSSNCLGRKCECYDDCFYFRTRKRLQNADLIIVNHALFFVDLALRKLGVNILPDYNIAVLDEAHTIQNVASDHLGLMITRGQVDFSLNKLFNTNKNKGLFVTRSDPQGQELVGRCRNAASLFFGDVLNWVSSNAKQFNRHSITLRVRQPDPFGNPLSPALATLANHIRDAAERIKETNDKLNFTSAAERIEIIAGQLENWRQHQLEDGVYWIESSTNRYGNENIKLRAAPIDVGPELRKHLFNKVDTCVLTSATIAIGGDSFDFFQNRIGLTQTQSCLLGSPFDYRSQAKLIVVRNMADPTKDKDTHQRQCIEAIKKFASETDGHAFVLCTSYSFLNRAVRDLGPWMIENNLQVYSQGAGVDRTQLLEQFKANPRGILFGTDSFWQGVDVQGGALTNVIIPKLPFSVPDQPLLEARLEMIRKRGGNPFNEYQLPEAIIKFKQGFGRLIRSQSDRGMVVVLDPRIHSKPYGRYFIESLPECDFQTLSL